MPATHRRYKRRAFLNNCSRDAPELQTTQPNALLAGVVVVSVIDVREAHLPLAGEGDPTIRNGDAMGAAAEILQQLPLVLGIPRITQQSFMVWSNALPISRGRRRGAPAGASAGGG
jgi:hypothetical protein